MRNLLIIIGLVLMILPDTVIAGESRPVDLDLGSTPDAVYRTYNRAKWRLDVDTVRACLSSRVQISREDLYNQILLERRKLPQVLRLLHVESGERLATLYYLGIREDTYDSGKTFYWRGTVTFVKEHGHWRIRHETWEDATTEPDAGKAKP